MEGMNKGCRGTQSITRVEALTTLDLKGQGDRVMGTWGEPDPGGELWSCRAQGLPDTHAACFFLPFHRPWASPWMTPSSQPLKPAVKGGCSPRGQYLGDRVVGEGQMETSPHGDPEGRRRGVVVAKTTTRSPDAGVGAVSPRAQVSFCSGPPQTGGDSQLACLLPQAPAVPVPIDSVGSSVSVPRMVLPQGRGVNPASP